MTSIKDNYDVLVAGGGFSGVAAAVASARAGASTLLVERSMRYGGVACEAMHERLCGLYHTGKGREAVLMNEGFAAETERALLDRGLGRVVRSGKVQMLQYERHALVSFFDAVTAAEANLDRLSAASVDSLRVVDGLIKSAGIVSEEGEKKIEASFFIDATGAGKLMQQSGAAFYLAPCQERQMAALSCAVEGVKTVENLSLMTSYALAKAAESGLLEKHLRFTSWMPGMSPGSGVLKMSVVPSDKAYDLRHLSEEMRSVFALLKAQVPAYENASIFSVGRRVVEREGVRLQGVATLSESDVTGCRKFTGSRVKACWPVEFWDQNLGPRYQYLPDGEWYEIPDEVLRSNTIDNLLSAGRSLSADPKALASARVSGTCLSTGERAGELAASFCRGSKSNGGSSRGMEKQ